MSAPAKFQPTSPPFRWDEAGGIRIGSSRVILDSLLAAYHNGSTRAHFMVGGMQFSTHFNGFFILARNLFAGGFGCKTIALKGLQNNRCIARS